MGVKWNWSRIWTGLLIQPKLPAESNLATQSEFASVFADQKGLSHTRLTRLIKFYHQRPGSGTGEITVVWKSEFINELGNLKIWGNWAHLSQKVLGRISIPTHGWISSQVPNLKSGSLQHISGNKFQNKILTEQNVRLWKKKLTNCDKILYSWH